VCWCCAGHPFGLWLRDLWCSSLIPSFQYFYLFLKKKKSLLVIVPTYRHDSPSTWWIHTRFGCNILSFINSQTMWWTHLTEVPFSLTENNCETFPRCRFNSR
jgi:hypothetical protein